jgi:hypothetical protein
MSSAGEPEVEYSPPVPTKLPFDAAGHRTAGAERGASSFRY